VNPSTVKDDDPRLVDLNPSLDLRIRNKSKEVFVEEELARRRQVHLAFSTPFPHTLKLVVFWN
jgi:DnaJ family protein C protein 8